MTEDTELLREIRDLLLVMAEPALAKHHERLREALIEIVGKSKARAKAVLLMDGSRPQAMIKKESGIDAGDLSRSVKALREANLIATGDDKHPKLVITVPPNFFENAASK
jgi:DNA-binding MarR family transcriptional regulator